MSTPLNKMQLNRVQRLLRQSEGYLDLEMPQHALENLRQIDDPGELEFEFDLLRGIAHKDLLDYSQALVYLEAAAALNRNSVSLQMALAWCYKRTARLPLAITATELAHQLDPQEPILMYNLACYFALAGDKEQALSWLGRALRLAPSVLRLIPKETDFDLLRHDPNFVRMLELAQTPKS